MSSSTYFETLTRAGWEIEVDDTHVTLCNASVAVRLELDRDGYWFAPWSTRYAHVPIRTLRAAVVAFTGVAVTAEDARLAWVTQLWRVR